MTWPTLNQSYKAIDLSAFNAGLDGHPADLAKILADNPDIDVVIVRCMWPSGLPDPWFEMYYDDAKEADKKVAAYAWPNPHKTVAQMVEDRKVALDGRIPDCLAEDVEDYDDIFGVSDKSVITKAVRGVLESDAQQYPKTKITPYCRGQNWDEMVIDGSWVNDWKYWVAHWIYPPFLYRQAYSFEELDKCLPVSNNFTPYVGHQIDPTNVIGWQASSRGKFAGIKGYVDIGYWLRSECDRIWKPKETVTLERLDLALGYPRPLDLGLVLPQGSTVDVGP